MPAGATGGIRQDVQRMLAPLISKFAPMQRDLDHSPA